MNRLLLEKYDFIKMTLDGIPLYWPRKVDVPARLKYFPDCCGAGVFECVPEKPFNITFSPACYVHDCGYISRPADKLLWREHFELNNDVFEYNLNSIIDNLSKNSFELTMNEFIKDVYLAVVRSGIGWFFYVN